MPAESGQFLPLSWKMKSMTQYTRHLERILLSELPRWLSSSFRSVHRYKSAERFRICLHYFHLILRLGILNRLAMTGAVVAEETAMMLGTGLNTVLVCMCCPLWMQKPALLTLSKRSWNSTVVTPCSFGQTFPSAYPVDLACWIDFVVVGV